MSKAIATTLAVAIVAAALGFSAGYGVKGQAVKANQFDAVVSAQKQTRTNVQQSLEKSAAIEVKTTASTQQVQTIRKAVAKRFEEKKPHVHEVAPAAGSPAVGDQAESWPACTWTLDVGTVGLLNAARTGADPGSASGSDAESQAPSGIGPEELIDNDLQVVEQYRDLAIRHDDLVDYVHGLLNSK